MPDVDGREITILEIPNKLTFLISRQSSLSAKDLDTHLGYCPLKFLALYQGQLDGAHYRK